MLSRLLKADAGLADVPSVPKQARVLRFILLVAIMSAAILAVPMPGSSRCPAPIGEDSRSTEIADAELLASSLPNDGGSHAWSVASAVAPDYTIRHTVPEVRLQFSAADERGHLVNNLQASDLRILDNSSAVREIRDFSHRQDLPLQVGMLLDVSDSVQKTILREKAAGQLFVRSVMRPAGDHVFLMTFASDVTVWQASTSDRATLARSLERIQQRGYVTNLYDGLFAACVAQSAGNSEHELAQHIIVLFSDGIDTGSLHALSDVVTAAQHNEIQLYALSVHSRRSSPSGDKILHHLAEQTGGHFYVANSEKDFPAIFAVMEQQMRTQYSVSFQPADQTPGLHSLQLDVAGSQKMQIHARQGYYIAAQ